jgi:serine/threonine-protein kinase ULK/ATG1
VQQKRTGAIIAIKSVNVKKLTKKLQDNLEAEVRILRELHHPHIVSLFDCKRTADKVHLCMEYCELGDLSTFIKKRTSLGDHEATKEMIKKYPLPQVGGLNEVVVRHFLQQIASALSFMREKALLHRDIKPQNLLLVPPRSWYENQGASRPHVMTDESSNIPIAGIQSLPLLKIADFGFARFLPSLELAETLCGSPLYMAPEILRYEKYDAKADLWSVGTVLHEMMVGKPPFRANNHVELLRKIEKNEDVIRFPAGLVISTGMKSIIRTLLKRIPTERVSYENFFADPVVTEQIPGLVGEDRPREQYTQNLANRIAKTRPAEALSSSPREADMDREASPRSHAAQGKAPAVAGPSSHRPSRLSIDERRESVKAIPRAVPAEGRSPPIEPTQAYSHERRPSLKSHITAPATEKPVSAAAITMERRNSRTAISPGGSMLKEHLDRERGKTDEKVLREARERERAAQEVAFEREYVVVEKGHVEVNAFADELAHSPQVGANHGAMARRATTSGVPYSSTAPTTSTQTRAMQQVARQAPLHQRTGSYERRYGRSPTSATSAISKALNMANFRLFGMGFSPPTGKGPSPPQPYSAFPQYPTGSSMLMIGDGGHAMDSRDDDFRIAHQIEDLAHRSDVIWGFADIKFQQLVPSRPIGSHGFGIGAMRRAADEAKDQVPEEPDLPVDHVVIIAEEALVLFVKVLAVLKKIMDISASWFHNSRSELPNTDVPRSAPTRGGTMAAAPRINSVVQWARTRFNDALEKSDFVARKLTDAQKRLPLDHPYHPSNKYASSSSMASVGTGSADHVMLTSGVTAEKLMYERALEMSRGAAVCELTNEDLENGVLSYRTAVYMLEAILDLDEFAARASGRRSVAVAAAEEGGVINGLEAEDRATVQKCKIKLVFGDSEKLANDVMTVLDSLRIRLRTIKKKIEAQKAAAKRSSSSGTPTVVGTTTIRASPSATPHLSRSPAR